MHKAQCWGIFDIAFLMQYAALRYATSDPSLVKRTDNIRNQRNWKQRGY